MLVNEVTGGGQKMIGVGLARQPAITTVPVVGETGPDRRPDTDLGGGPHYAPWAWAASVNHSGNACPEHRRKRRAHRGGDVVVGDRRTAHTGHHRQYDLDL
jgi:hypothetical protein